jgi:putative SOS response-associated peptidase YedK
MPAAAAADALAEQERPDPAEPWDRLPDGLSLVVLRDPATGNRVMATMRWGLRPSPPATLPILNVRAEMIAARGAIREALRRRRCLVPMDGYIQRASRDAIEGSFAVSLQDGAPMAVAAIWQDSEDGPRFALITCPANEAVGAIHDRMPVILPPHAWPSWLAGGLINPLDVWDLLKPCPSASLTVRRLPAKAPGTSNGSSVGAQLELMVPGAPLMQPGRPPRKARPPRAPARPGRRQRNAVG